MLEGTGADTGAVLSGSKVGVSSGDMARPHEEQKRTFPDITAPHPEQVIMGTDYIAVGLICPPGISPLKMVLLYLG